MANRSFTRSFYSLEEYPVIISCNFIVDNTQGAGIRSLKGPGVAHVFMNTSATPASGSPNPAAGTILVELQDNYNRILNSFKGIISPLSGSPLTSVTAGVAYVITVVGTTTAAQFHAKGVPVGVTPAVGVAFVATATGALGGSGSVQIAAAAGSGVASLEILGDPNASIAPYKASGQGYGAYVIFQARDYAGAIVAPAAGSTIAISLYLSNGSNTVQGN